MHDVEWFLMNENEELISEINKAFSNRIIPQSILSELYRGHEETEFAYTYDSLRGVNWRDLDDEKITASYGCLNLVSDTIFGYYLPAVMIHVINSKDDLSLGSLVRRFLRSNDQDEFRYRFGLDKKQQKTVTSFFSWSLKQIELDYRTRRRVETFLEQIA